MISNETKADVTAHVSHLESIRKLEKTLGEQKDARELNIVEHALTQKGLSEAVGSAQAAVKSYEKSRETLGKRAEAAPGLIQEVN